MNSAACQHEAHVGYAVHRCLSARCYSRSFRQLALQVLISIQSMILVDDPYYNEPGYESSRTTSAGKQQCESYNRQQECHTICHSILAALRHPDPCFQAIIRLAHKCALPCPYVLGSCFSSFLPAILTVNSGKQTHCMAKSCLGSAAAAMDMSSGALMQP